MTENLPEDAGLDASPPPRRGFWARRYPLEPNLWHKIFDVVLGIVLPLICLVADPFVFKDEFTGRPGLFGALAMFAYTAAALSMAALLVWMVFHPRSAFLAGMLLAGAIFSLIVGLVLLPFSLIGLIIVIGVLGFTPLGTALIYHRNYRRAVRRLNPDEPVSLRNLAVMAGCASVIVLSVFAQVSANQMADSAVSAIFEGREPNVVGMAMLRSLPLRIGLDDVVQRYEVEIDPVQKERLAKAYLAATGDNIERRLAQMND
jgi:hypothetical protein